MSRNSRWPTAFLAAMVFITASLLVPVRAEPMRGINVGDSILPRTIKTLAGEEMTIPAKEGITVLVYWATWNPRSRPALSTWEKYAEEYKDQPVTVIAVNADHQKMGTAELQAVKDYIEKNNVGLPVYVDTGLELYNEIGVIVLPTTLFFHSDGKLVFKRGSFSTSAPLDLKEALEQELGIGKSKEEIEKEKKEWEAVFKPKNNALLYFNLGKQLVKRGMKDKARDRWIIALQRDPGYADPLIALENYFFVNGRTPEAETALKDLLKSKGLGALTDHLSLNKWPVKVPENLESPIKGSVMRSGNLESPDSGAKGATVYPAP